MTGTIYPFSIIFIKFAYPLKRKSNLNQYTVMALINCPECSAQISSEAPFCPHCGAPVASKQPEESAQPQEGQVTEQPQAQQPAQASAQPCGCGCTPQPQATPCTTKELPPKTWLLESILATLFCCLPFGVVGIIYAARVESNWYAGQKELARSSASTAKTWTLISFFFGLAGALGYGILMAFGLMSSVMGALIN